MFLALEKLQMTAGNSYNSYDWEAPLKGIDSQLENQEIDFNDLAKYPSFRILITNPTPTKQFPAAKKKGKMARHSPLSDYQSAYLEPIHWPATHPKT